MLGVLEKGGILMYPIMALSILSLGVFIERMITLRQKVNIPKDFISKLYELISASKDEEAEKLCTQEKCPFASIGRAILSNRTLKWEQILIVAEEEGKKEVGKLSKFQSILVMVIALAPLLGLLGTILGMINIFNVLAGNTVQDAHALSGGIAEALITTAAGLSVAIPATIFYYIVKYKAETIINKLEGFLVELMKAVFYGQIQNKEGIGNEPEKNQAIR